MYIKIWGLYSYMTTKKDLIILLSLPSLDGTIALASLSGMLTMKNVLLIAVGIIAGPAAILVASTLEGAVSERMTAALFSGLLATALVVLAACIGPKILSFTNIAVLRLTSGIAVLLIGLIIMGIRIPNQIPTVMIVGGMLASVFWR